MVVSFTQQMFCHLSSYILQVHKNSITFFACMTSQTLLVCLPLYRISEFIFQYNTRFSATQWSMSGLFCSRVLRFDSHSSQYQNKINYCGTLCRQTSEILCKCEEGRQIRCDSSSNQVVKNYSSNVLNTVQIVCRGEQVFLVLTVKSVELLCQGLKVVLK